MYGVELAYGKGRRGPAHNAVLVEKGHVQHVVGGWSAAGRSRPFVQQSRVIDISGVDGFHRYVRIKYIIGVYRIVSQNF